MSESDPPVADKSPTTKVARLITQHGFGELGAELERRWVGQDSERDSLRTLADVFNQRLLEHAMNDAGINSLNGEVENIYELLTDDSVTSGTRTETVTRLRQHGIDVDRLTSDFVTYQAIRTYLMEVRGVKHTRNKTDPIESATSSFDRLMGRTTAVVERKLQSLASSETLILGSFRVRTTVSVYCEDCENQYDVTTLLTREGCDCKTDREQTEIE